VRLAFEMIHMRRPLAELLAISLAMLALASGCDPDRQGLPGPASVAADSISAADRADNPVTPVASAELSAGRETSLPDPAEAVSIWRTWRQEKRYRLLEACIKPDQSAAFIDTLIAVDLVLAANEEVRQAIAEVLGEHRTELWDLSALGDNLGIFSSGMNIISVERKQDQATVTFQVGDRLPLESAQLHGGPKGWLYAPGPAPTGWPAQLRRLATGLTDVAEVIRRERPDAVRINQEFRLRIFPQLKALERAPVPDVPGGE
jgi:hypothetical protein